MDRLLRFVCRLDDVFRVLTETPAGCWLIDCDGPSLPFFASDLEGYDRVPAPDSWMTEQTITPAQEARLQMIQPLLDCTDCISDKSLRYQMAAEAAQQNQTTTRRILRLYYRYLATGRLTQKRTQQASKSNQMIERAIRRYYYGSKRLSLRAAYEMMLLEDYVGPDGQLDSDAPTWSQFRHYYYGHSLHKDPQKIIAREGLTKYQRDYRPAWGSSAGWRPQPGSYQMDATQADIYLVSRADRSIVVGRPYIYMAVDTATHLIAGVYIGFACDETAVMACIEQAAMDKVEYCARYGIEIIPEQWPSAGMPSEIITDQGREFFGPRMGELCKRYGLEVLTLPPFRPDFKGTVEKSIDLLQERYKPMLRGKGVIEDDAQERWATDYRAQAVLDLDDFTRIVIHSILYLNSGRIIKGKAPAERWLELSPRLMAVDPQELHIQTLPRDTAKLYYIPYGGEQREDVIWQVGDALNGSYAVTAETIANVIDELAACGLFSGDLFRRDIITSTRAQKAYYTATVDRKYVDVNFDIWLLSESDMRKLSSKSVILQSFISRPINAENRPTNGDNQPSGAQSREQKSREQQSTEKYSKAEQSRERAVALAADLERLIGSLIDDNFRLDIARLMQAGMQEVVIMEAARQTDRKRPRNPAAYLRTILQGYERDGILTAADLEATQGKEPRQQPVDDGYLHPGSAESDEDWVRRVREHQKEKQERKKQEVATS